MWSSFFLYLQHNNRMESEKCKLLFISQALHHMILLKAAASPVCIVPVGKLYQKKKTKKTWQVLYFTNPSNKIIMLPVSN